MPTKQSKQQGPSSPLQSLPTSLPLIPFLCPSSRPWLTPHRSVAMALRCTDGVILGVERLLHSKLLVKGANRRIQSVDEHIGVATAGLLADGKHLASRGREEAHNFRDQYNSAVTVAVSAQLPLRSGRIVADPVFIPSVRPIYCVFPSCLRPSPSSLSILFPYPTCLPSAPLLWLFNFRGLARISPE